jgi:hypothetical protein
MRNDPSFLRQGIFQRDSSGKMQVDSVGHPIIHRVWREWFADVVQSQITADDLEVLKAFDVSAKNECEDITQAFIPSVQPVPESVQFETPGKVTLSDIEDLRTLQELSVPRGIVSDGRELECSILAHTQEILGPLRQEIEDARLLAAIGPSQAGIVKIGSAGTIGTIPKFIGASTLGDSIITETTGLISIAGTVKPSNIDLTAAAVPAAPAAGEIRTYAVADDGFTVLETITDLGMIYRINQDNFRVARNTSGAPIAKARAVYYTGSTGNKPNFAMAKADSSATMPAVAITTIAVNDNNFAEIMIIGRLTGIDTSAWNEGDSLYVSPTTAGELTNVKPSFPNIIQWVGTVEVKSATVGVVLVHIQSVETDVTTQRIGTLINGAAAKNPPIDADMLGLMDSAAGNILTKLSWLNVKGTLKTYFDAVYTLANLGGVPTTRTINTTAPLTGGGDLSADRTFAIPKATALVDGYLDHVDFASFLTSVTSHNVLSATHGDTLADSVARGDVMYGNATPKWARLPFPATPTGKILQATTTDIAWSANPLTIGASASVSGSNTGDNAANSSTMYIGTTAHALNRGTGAEGLAGITSLTPGTDFTLAQNSVNVITSIEAGAIVNTLYLTEGKVGIGTTAPLSKLHVSAVALAGGEPTYRGAVIIDTNNANASTNGLEFKIDSATNGYGYRLATIFNGVANYDLRIQNRQSSASWSDVVTVAGANGNVGIGTTAPSAKLDITGTFRTTDLTTPTSGVGLEIGYAIASSFGFLTAYDRVGAIYKNIALNDTVYIIGGNTGNVGIGTTAPSAKLAINGGLHVGGVTDPGDNNLLVDGTGVITGGFGCNGKTAQTAYASGGAAAAVAGTATSGGYGFVSAAEMNDFITAVNAIKTLANNHRSALIANGIES